MNEMHIECRPKKRIPDHFVAQSGLLMTASVSSRFVLNDSDGVARTTTPWPFPDGYFYALTSDFIEFTDPVFNFGFTRADLDILHTVALYHMIVFEGWPENTKVYYHRGWYQHGQILEKFDLEFSLAIEKNLPVRPMTLSRSRVARIFALYELLTAPPTRPTDWRLSLPELHQKYGGV